MSLDTVGNAPTKLSRFVEENSPEEMENLAARIEGAFVPLTVLELSQLCAALCRGLAAVERRLTALDDPSRG